MSMMKSNDVGNMSDIHMMMMHPRKLRPLMPRPSAATTKSPTSSSTMSSAPPPHHYFTPSTSICAWNYHLTASSVHHQSCKRSSEFMNAEPLVSPRWNPTAEQIEALEDMYRRGLRTPTAEQIQQIAAKLRQFGKIEGKNVFYWFQNHKARERQKWRRQLGFLPEKKKSSRDVETIKKKESAEICEKDVEDDQQHKNWESLSICSRISEDSSISKHRAVMAESRISKRKRVKKATLQADLSSHHQPHNTIAAFKNSSTKCTNLDNDDDDGGDDDIKMEIENRENHQILQLFPPRSNKEKENEVLTPNTNATSFTPIQFFEFLPLKT